ncbi:GntR family transcriptional regulator [Rhodoligotrophos defluvii]|uniref:GntR family transcriptional regulator n=1 Tax=Rhodoligotrophos defluvii TaxID=2561934 RepID=UPI0010C9A341|nr:GntR family transcriptional regulator [Rhodoligotrophos defluvii]
MNAPAGKPMATDVVQQVYAAVQSMLARFDIKPSERVNEVELANRLGVSRTPVREALNRLSTEGFVTFVPNRGFYARSLELKNFIDLYELRAGVEGVAAAAACTVAEDAAIKALADDWNRTLDQVERMSGSALAEADERFHESLVALAGNEEMNKVIRNINLRIRFVRQCAIEQPEQRQATVSEHAGIVEALLRRDRAQARDLVEKHVSITAEKALDFVTRSLALIYLKP